MTVSTSYRTTSSRRSFLPSPLASAIIGSLLMAASLPALAQGGDDEVTRYQFQRSLQASFAAPSLSTFAAPATGFVPADAGPEMPVMGTPGDLASWRSTEFNNDWGLQAINADAAYARGLTGKGIRLGVFDSGVGLDHPEFAGKDHRSIHLADLLADGSPCTNTAIIAGPGACFSTDGNTVAIEALGFGATLDDADIDYLIAAGAPYGMTYNSHGTHVAGTMVGNRDGSGMHGVAFGADLTTARLFFNSYSEWNLVGNYYIPGSPFPQVGPSPETTADMYAQMNAQGVRAINHSWGLGQEPETLEDLDGLYDFAGNDDYFAIYADGSRERGMVQVWAAGNNNANPATPEQAPIAGVYATLPRKYADIEAYWLSVVNVRPDGDSSYVLDESSNRCGYSANWCLAAPGTDIYSTEYANRGLTGSIDQDADGNVVLDVVAGAPEHTYGNKTGTSMAAPHVTGALALLFERFPYLDSAQVRDVLLTTTTDLGAAGVDDVYGWGLMNLAKAIEGYGSLRVDTDVVMNQKAGGLKVWEGDAWDDWTNDIGGPGKLTKSGAGWLRLSGNNSFNGAVVREGVLELDGVNTLASAVDVTGGSFLLNGTLKNTALTTLGGVSRVNASGVLDGSNLTIMGGVLSFNGVQTGGLTFVGEKGTLKGVGQLGDTTVAGIIAPGNSIGTLTINGNYVQTATGVYQAEVAPGSRSDQLHVTGTATLGGTLVALPEPGIYYLGEQFNFIRADGGVSGQFATTDFSAFSPFMQFNLVYGAAGTRIEVARGNSLTTAATTANQRSVATVADGLAVGQGLPRPLTMLFPEQVGAALDSLSGEVHAATAAALLESSRYVRDAALSRRAGATAPGASEGDATGLWVQAIGGSITLDGNSNTARSEANNNGLLVGVDREFGGWQVGLLAGTGRTDLKQQQGRRARSKIDNTHFGAYASHNWGGFGLRGGVAWSNHDVDSTRELAFAGYSDTLSARYDARTRQAFIEAAYRFGGREAGLEPYLQVARVEVDTKHVTEHGGAAALQGRVDDARTTVATAGVRFDKGLKASFQQDSWLHLRGAVGYRRASGDRDPSATLAFASGSDAFVVSGAPIADSAVVAELGLSASLTERQQLELGYSGQYGDESRDHGANLRWSVRF
ncbi:TPA: autotransporter domain-containing protein [Stenotrophomonas maltophilia]|nr:autotransporter domain-containing protein [Stenotrophomonas maltophilia]HDS1043185.1 autotransporter domain-containing protein [Stenotrophomonas maltophilia]